MEEKPPEPGAVHGAIVAGADMLKSGYTQASQATRQVMGVQEERKRNKPRYSGPFVGEIRRRLDAYFALVVRNIRDAVPKAIGFFLVRQVQEKIQYELLRDLNQGDKVVDLLGEPPHIREERKSLAAQLSVLQKAHNVLTRDPTLAAIAFDAEDEIAAQPATAAPVAPKPMMPAQGPPQQQFAPAARPAAVQQPPAGAPGPGMPKPAMQAPPGGGGGSGLFGANKPTGGGGLFGSGGTQPKNPLLG